MASLLLVSATQGLAARIPEVLAGHGHEVTIVGTPKGQLVLSPFIDAYEVVCQRPSDLATALESDPSVMDRGADWVLYDDDALIGSLARGSLSDEVKQRVLPASTAMGRAMLGSKVGQQAIAEATGIPTPRTFVAECVEEVRRAVAELGGSALIKADVGGGGIGVWRVDSARDIDRIRALDEKFPVLVQEFVSGGLVSVEPLYRHGQLLGFTYSVIMRAMRGGKGPSTVRRFVDPPSAEVQESLEALGSAAGAHGFANVTFMWCPRRRQHLLIECDLRITSCVQYGPSLGVDWGALMAGSGSGSVGTTSLGSQGRVVHVYPRALSAVISEGSLGLLLPWLRREPGTWEMRNQRDPVVNAVERASLIGPRALARYALHDPLRAAWMRLPADRRRSIEVRGWKRSGLGAMGIDV